MPTKNQIIIQWVFLGLIAFMAAMWWIFQGAYASDSWLGFEIIPVLVLALVAGASACFLRAVDIGLGIKKQMA